MRSTLKVLICLRQDAFLTYGGDILHAEKVAEHLRKLGCQVDINTSTTPPVADYDIIHIFNLDWVRDAYDQVNHALKFNKKIVLTPIHHSFEELDDFEKNMRYGLTGFVNKFVPQYQQREMLKNIYRTFIQRDPSKLRGTIRQLTHGLMREYRFVLENSTLVMPNTELERSAIKDDFKVNPRMVVVPAGVELTFQDANPDWFKKNYPEISSKLGDEFVLSVGRIELRKNQLRLIEAVQELGIGLLLVGRPNLHHSGYVKNVLLQVESKDNCFHIPSIAHDNLGSVYSAAGIHALVSWAETTGLVNLEAALAGCRIVASKRGFAKEYLNSEAFLVDPGDTKSIIDGLDKAINSKPSEELKKTIIDKYTWDSVAEATLKGYQLIK